MTYYGITFFPTPWHERLNGLANFFFFFYFFWRIVGVHLSNSDLYETVCITTKTQERLSSLNQTCFIGGGLDFRPLRGLNKSVVRIQNIQLWCRRPAQRETCVPLLELGSSCFFNGFCGAVCLGFRGLLSTEARTMTNSQRVPLNDIMGEALLQVWIYCGTKT